MKSQKQSGAGGQDAEQGRLIEAREQQTPWRKWGPYLSERQWGTVREDYSQDGNAWNYFSHDHSRSRAYRWGEDGIAGLSDDKQRLCFALALWNERDPILKERLFGLTNSEGNHGEDVKEYYFYLDSTPTHSYMKYLYKYPQAAYPYLDLVETNGRRSRDELEYELLDTGVFDKDRYFDVFVEYAKASTDDVLIKISIHNRGPEAAPTPPSADAVVSQYVVVGTHGAETRVEPRRGSADSRVSSRARRLHAPLRRRRTTAVHGERIECRPAVGRTQCHPVRQGCVSRVRDRRTQGGGQSGALGNEGRRTLPYRRPCRRLTSGAPATQPGVRRPALCDVRHDPRAAAAGSRRVLRSHHAGIARRRRAPRPSSSARRNVVVEAVLLLRSRHVARGAQCASAARGRVTTCGTPSGSTC